MHDSLGNAVTTDSGDALRLIDLAIDMHARAWPGALEAAQAAVAQAPQLAIAHALEALIHGTWGRKRESDAAMERAMAHVGGTSPRERSLVELLSHVVRGRTHLALASLLVHARRHPTDLLALTTGMGAYGVFAFSGRADHVEARLELLDDLVTHFPPDYPWLLAYRAWARIELGAVDEGLAMAFRAMDLRPENAHNAHIIAHGLHEANRHGEYLDYLAGWLPGYPDTALMWGHLNWHAALAELALLREDAAIRRCLGPVMDYLRRGVPFMGLADAPSLLWKLGLRGVSGLPWSQVAAHAEQHFPRGSNPFGELHLAMLAASCGDIGALQAGRQRLEKLAGEGYMGAPTAIEWTRGLQALIERREGDADAHFAACEADAVRLGGSKAQRSIIGDTRATRRLPASAVPVRP